MLTRSHAYVTIHTLSFDGGGQENMFHMISISTSTPANISEI